MIAPKASAASGRNETREAGITWPNPWRELDSSPFYWRMFQQGQPITSIDILRGKWVAPFVSSVLNQMLYKCITWLPLLALWHITTGALRRLQRKVILILLQILASRSSALLTFGPTLKFLQAHSWQNTLLLPYKYAAEFFGFNRKKAKHRFLDIYLEVIHPAQTVAMPSFCLGQSWTTASRTKLFIICFIFQTKTKGTPLPYGGYRGRSFLIRTEF